LEGCVEGITALQTPILYAYPRGMIYDVDSRYRMMHDVDSLCGMVHGVDSLCRTIHVDSTTTMIHKVDSMAARSA
jgi:hypothetical protein